MKTRLSALLLFALAHPLMGTEGITKLKDLHLKTVIAQGGKPQAIIVVPSPPGYAAVADIVQEAVEKLAGVTLPVKQPTQITEQDLKRFNLIVLGNVPDNELVRRLYRERRIADVWHPFDERHVVRSIHNPYGHGKNILFIGGENPVPVRAAAEKFVKMLKPGDPLTIGWVMSFETETRAAALTEKQIQAQTEQAKKMLGFKNGRSLISKAAGAARNYYTTGQDGWAEVFKICMRHHKAIGAPGMGTHMNVYDTIAWWDLIEESPAFSDEDRLFIAKHFLYIMRSKEGANHSFFRKGTKTAGVRHNHQTLPGLAALFGGRYFKNGYALPEADEWIAAAKALFDAQKVSHKPQCDCNLYEWGTLYQTAWWSLAGGDYAFFKGGACRAAADRALLELDNLGNSALNGDCWSATYCPTTLFRQAAEFYRDGRYEWAIRKHYASSTARDRRGVAGLVRGIEPKEPTELLGVVVAPMSPHFYRAHETTMPSEPEPNIPIEDAFDKISFRQTFDPEDPYLLLDGIGMGSHGHIDVNGVSHFTDNSRVWLMDMSYAEGPSMRDHNVVTVQRDGQTKTPPPLAARKGIADLQSIAFCETVLPKYCGTDWHRSIFWVKAKYFLFIDQIVAVEPGDYHLRCYWRTLGDPTLDGNTFTARQQEKPPSTPVKKITRKDAEGGTCMKFMHESAALTKKVNLTKGAWTVTVVGCGHNGGDDSLYVDLDGTRAGQLSLSQHKIAPATPIPLEIEQDGAHTITLTLREKPGTICDRVLLNGPDGKAINIDALDLEIPLAPPQRMDTFTLVFAGADKASLTRDAENFGKWWKTYRYAEPVVNILKQSASRQMKTGARHCFANLFCVSSGEKPADLKMLAIADGVVLIQDGIDVICMGVGPAEFLLGDAKVKTHAEQFVLSATRVAAREATLLEWRGELIASKQPTSIEKAIGKDKDLRTEDLRLAWDRAAKEEQEPPPTRQADVPPLKSLWRTRLESPLCSLARSDVNGDGRPEIAAACANGKVILLDGNGKPLWEFEAGGKANTVAIADLDGDGTPEILAGSDDRRCYVLDASGKERWHYEGAEGHDPYWRSYWKAGEVEKVLAADIYGDAKKEVIFAAANMHIHACSPTGDLLWRFGQYGVCSSILAADLTGDGKMEIVGGPAKITCTSNCNVIDQKGKAISRYGNDGWASALTAVCAADLDGDGRPEIVCGTNMNNVYALNTEQGKLARRWKYTAGDAITALAAATLDPGKAEHVIVGSDSEYVYALDGSGKKAWTRNLHDGVCHVATSDLDHDGRDEVIAATPHAIHVLDHIGKPIATFPVTSRITGLDVDPDIVIGTDDGTLWRFALPE